MTVKMLVPIKCCNINNYLTKCVRPAVCERIEGGSGVPEQFFKATDAVAICSD